MARALETTRTTLDLTTWGGLHAVVEPERRASLGETVADCLRIIAGRETRSVPMFEGWYDYDL